MTSELGSGTGGPPLTELAPLLGFLSQVCPPPCVLTSCGREQLAPSVAGVQPPGSCLGFVCGSSLFYLDVESWWEKLETDLCSCPVTVISMWSPPADRVQDLAWPSSSERRTESGSTSWASESHLSPALSRPLCIFFPDAFWHTRRATSLRTWVPCGTILQGSQSHPEVPSSW